MVEGFNGSTICVGDVASVCGAHRKHPSEGAQQAQASGEHDQLERISQASIMLHDLLVTKKKVHVFFAVVNKHWRMYEIVVRMGFYVRCKRTSVSRNKINNTHTDEFDYYWLPRGRPWDITLVKASGFFVHQ